MRFTLLFLSFILVLPLISQKKEKLELENLRGKKVYVKPGSDFTLTYEKGDTLYNINGFIDSISSDSIYFNKWYESKQVFQIEKNIHKETMIDIEYVDAESEVFTRSKKYNLYQNQGLGVKIGFGIAAGVGLFSTLVVAPLASIDKNSPYNFNARRYQTIVYSSLIFTGATLVVSLSIPSGRTLKLPKVR